MYFGCKADERKPLTENWTCEQELETSGKGEAPILFTTDGITLYPSLVHAWSKVSI